MDWGSDTARFPKKLDRTGIISRLGELHEWARSEGRADLTALLELPADASGAEIGSRVLSALALVEGRPDYAVITKQLQILALNLKNLK